MKKNNKLNPKEQLYKEDVLKGLSNKEIAEKHNVVIGNIKNTLTRVYRKLGYKTRAEMISAELS